ncbi:MAG: hypothetical protein K8R85_12385, partial [Bacteroidetes bacterium]|nr:hypothetical protein [Bacteroidota bacterium]
MVSKFIRDKFDKQDQRVLIGISLYFVILVLVAINTSGTSDSGDSITHFLFSKYAFQHPENFLNHWAKPLFVLLSAPFSQTGFIGIKVFNCIIAVFSAWFSYKIAKKINYKNAWLTAVFLCFTPGYFVHIFSGLTEPLFSLIIMLGIYWLLNNKLLLAVCAISFLPFVRSEGLIIIGVFAFYLLINQQYKYLPGLLFGHFFYSIAGVFYYHDLFWVFTKIPYINSSGKYGSGNLSHFIIQFNYILGIPLYILFGLGLVKKSIALFTNKKKDVKSLTMFRAETVLIYGLFFAFFIAHTLFWYFGIFESMGLKRVLISVVPLATVIALNGFNFITEIFDRKVIFRQHTALASPIHTLSKKSLSGSNLSRIVAIVFVGFVIVFPFVPNPASVNWKRDLSLSADQTLISDAVNFIRSDFPENTTFLYYTHPYVSLLMNRDPFKGKYNHDLQNFTVQKRPSHYLVIWDNWFSAVENGVSLEQLKADSRLKLLKSFQTIDKGREIQVVVFE